MTPDPTTREGRAALRATAEAATPGPWNVDGPFWVDPPGVTPSEMTVETRAGVSGKDRALVMPGTWETKDADAAHIARMDPATTLALLDALDALQARADAAEAEAARLLVRLHGANVEAERQFQRAEAAEAQVADLQAKVGALHVTVDREQAARAAAEAQARAARFEIAEVRYELGDSLTQISRVKAVHHPVEIEPSETICGGCSTRRGEGATLRYFPFVEWPCPTVAALEGSPTSHTHDTTQRPKRCLAQPPKVENPPPGPPAPPLVCDLTPGHEGPHTCRLFGSPLSWTNDTTEEQA